MRYFLLLISFLLLAPQGIEAAGVVPSAQQASSVQGFSVDGQKVKEKKAKKKRHSPKKNKGKDAAIPALLFWWAFMPLLIIGLITGSFLLGTVFLWPLWIAGLGVFGLWAGISGAVFFPIQYVGLPLGMAIIVLGLITQSILLWTAGLGLLFAALFAFSFMVLMFLIGTRKNQPK